ncbi:acyltransferase [Rhizobium sp. TH2]|uniref:acyltransferase family protein n=1 Tax=Rhizobium sp. TH2 TaxID=2775403 RepID=UPI0021581E23|nr:acyltransferase [Rhizobium sp. TH2]UVC11642.1 acyltransferase [Rhizobium sp. TH2]
MRSLALDGLRALPVLVIIADHSWLDALELPFGHLGVRFFFVLSGFFITAMLIRARDKVDFRRQSALFSFYVRRVLRTFPPYFLMLGVVLYFNVADVRDTWLWHVTFTTNFLFAWVNNWEPWILGHMWSLCIQEQFYLLWPLLIFVVPKTHYGTLCWGFIALSLLYRIVVIAMGPYVLWVHVLPPASWDALAVGSLLAIARSRDAQGPRMNWMVSLGLLGASLWLAVLDIPNMHVFWSVWSLGELAGLYPLVHLINTVASGRDFYILKWAPMVFLGRISFGLYLYHVMAIAALYRYLPSQSEPTALRFLCVTAVTVTIAILSWYCMERPIMRVRDTLMRPRPAAAGSSA